MLDGDLADVEIHDDLIDPAQVVHRHADQLFLGGAVHLRDPEPADGHRSVIDRPRHGGGSRGFTPWQPVSRWPTVATTGPRRRSAPGTTRTSSAPPRTCPEVRTSPGAPWG